MELSTKYKLNTYYVTNNVIYKIEKSSSLTLILKDENGRKVELSSDYLPKITVNEENDTSTIYYLDTLIEVGDYCFNNGNQYSFSKALNESDSTNVTYFNAFKEECEDVIKSYIKLQKNKTNDELTSILTSSNITIIPSYMVKSGAIEELGDVCAIEIDIDFINESREVLVKELIQEYGQKISQEHQLTLIALDIDLESAN